MTKKNPVGRPSKFNNLMPALIIEYGVEGLSKTQIAVALGISMNTLYDWCNKDAPTYNKDFSYAVQVSQEIAQATFEKLAKDNIIDPDGKINNRMFGLIMRNRFGWDSKSTIEHTGADGKELTFNFNLVPAIIDATEIPPKRIGKDDEDLSS